CPDCGSDVPVTVLLDTEYGPFPNPNPDYKMPVPELSDVVEVAAGYEHAIALRSWGDVFFWGSSGFYPFTHTYARVPNGVDPVDIAHIAAGGFHDLLLGSNGVVHAWGQNGYGQIGNGLTGIVDAPGVTVLNNIAAIAAGKYHSVALDKSGRIWTWGLNDQGQLGDGTTAPRHTPVATKWNRILAIAAGDRYTMGLRADGSIVTFGQLSGPRPKKADKALDLINQLIP
ncbi:MAG: chromosome condensation regulator, partial [Verrucomicrobiales bacterium]|nr:chromosome condensation regulator [Verrucomicrobiales bacterium]